MVSCKKCSEVRVVKAGYQRRHQRYECKCCGCNFIEGDRRSNKEEKLKSLLYSQGKGSYGFIGKLMNKHRSTVYRWVKKRAQALPDPVIAQGIKDIEIDEMWHYIQRKKTNYGSSKL
jgi:transposase-like protein